MKATQWAGRITNASPYALPPGALAVQDNLQSTVPGELTTRGGMRLLTAGEEDLAGMCFSILSCVRGGQSVVISLASDGTVVAYDGVAKADPPEAPDLPLLAPQSGEVQSSYAGEFDGEFTEDL